MKVEGAKEGGCDAGVYTLHSLWKVCWEKGRAEASGTNHDLRKKHFHGNGKSRLALKMV